MVYVYFNSRANFLGIGRQMVNAVLNKKSYAVIVLLALLVSLSMQLNVAARARAPQRKRSLILERCLIS